MVTLFSKARDLDLESIVKLLSEDEKLITTIHQNYKEKREAITLVDQKLWSEIIKKEESQLMNVLN